MENDESYVALPWDQVVKRCDERVKEILAYRVKSEADVYARWVEKKNASRWRKFWGRPQVTVADAQAYYAYEQENGDVWARMCDPVLHARGACSDALHLAYTVRQMAARSRDVTGKVHLSRSDFDSIGF